MKRLFLAIPLPNIWLDQLGGLVEQFNIKGVRWTNKENLHITVLFLGDIREEEVAFLLEGLEIIRTILAFKLEFNDLIFAPPGQKPPRMIWAKIKPSQKLTELGQMTYEISKDFCQVRPPHKQTPHITLARLKDYANFEKIRLPQLNLGFFDVKKVKLIESVLTPQGPIYQEMKRWTLQGQI